MIFRRRVAATVALILLGAPLGSARADDEAAAEAALARGAARPMGELLERVRAQFGSRVLKVELEYEDDGGPPSWIYEVKLLTGRGDVLKLEYDAATLELVSLKGRHQEREDD